MPEFQLNLARALVLEPHRRRRDDRPCLRTGARHSGRRTRRAQFRQSPERRRLGDRRDGQKRRRREGAKDANSASSTFVVGNQP